MTLNSDQSVMDALRDALDDAIADAYAGGALGRGWTFMGDPISKDEMAARIVQDPDKMRHLSRMQSAAWDIVKAHVEDPAASDERQNRGS